MGDFSSKLLRVVSKTNEKLLPFSILFIIGAIFGKFWISLALILLGYLLNLAGEFFYGKSLNTFYFALIYLLAIVLRNSLNAFLFVLLLYILELGFNFLMRMFLRPVYAIAPIGLELVLFNTVIVGYGFGPIAGIITGLLFGTTYYGIIFSFNSQYQLINIPAYAIIGYLAGTIATGNIVQLGMTLAAGYAIITSAIIWVLMGGKLYKSLTFIVTNLIFNYLLFTNLSDVILRIIT